jgi:hypothetical protein
MSSHAPWPHTKEPCCSTTTERAPTQWPRWSLTAGPRSSTPTSSSGSQQHHGGNQLPPWALPDHPNRAHPDQGVPARHRGLPLSRSGEGEAQARPELSKKGVKGGDLAMPWPNPGGVAAEELHRRWIWSSDDRSTGSGSKLRSSG